MSKKSTVRLFMVPIYINVEDGFDHGITLNGCLSYMSDQFDMVVRYEGIVDCGRQRGSDIPKEFKND